jgi:hypothetical protein
MENHGEISITKLYKSFALIINPRQWEFDLKNGFQIPAQNFKIFYGKKVGISEI